MRSKLLFLVMAASAAMLSCNGPAKDYVLKVKLQKLDEKNLYDKDLVYDVIFDAEELNIDSLQNRSRQLFLQAIDMYKNKRNAAGSVKLFKSSILTFPDAKAYYELGNALVDSKGNAASLKEALDAYEVAEHLGLQPLSGIAFKMACANYMLYNMQPGEENKGEYYYRTLSSLREAFSNGFTDTAAIGRDPRIRGIAATAEYRTMLTDMVTQGMKSRGSSLFDIYTRSFPALASAHFEIDKDQVDMKDHKVSISYDFAPFIPEMQNSNFSREVSHDYFYVAKLAQTPEYTAVVYSSVSFYGEDMQPVNTTLAIYDNEGNLKARKLISCQCSAEKIKTVSIDNNEIVIEDYKRIWDKPITTVSFENNSVKSYELLSQATYRIDDHGTIVDKEVPKNYNDTTIVAAR